MIKVLIVDDDTTTINIIKSFFEKIDGFSIAGVYKNGIDAFDFLESSSVDLILADITMPLMDGFTFIEKLREKHNYVDIIFVTAMNDTAAVKNALKYGAIDYIVKPFGFGRFLCAMQNYKVRYTLLNKKRSVNQYEIDKIISNSNTTDFNGLLPKGINQITLNTVLEVIDSFENDFTIEDLLEKIKMSKVSLRNYMRFLSQEGIVNARIKRGSVGRPLYLFRKMP